MSCAAVLQEFQGRTKGERIEPVDQRTGADARRVGAPALIVARGISALCRESEARTGAPRASIFRTEK
jgi:hypothetical protein